MKDIEAYQIALKAFPNQPEGERQFALTIARQESGYGNWKPSQKTIEISQKFGLTGFEGVDSNNWGAVQGKGTAGSFPHVDHHADGKAYVGQFQKNNLPEDGYKQTVLALFSGGKRGFLGSQELKDALKRGSLRDAVFVQHNNGYFELNPEKYLELVLINYNKLTTNAGLTKILSENGFSSGNIDSNIIGQVLVYSSILFTGYTIYQEIFKK